MQSTKNIQKACDLTPRGWHSLIGKKIHLVICGNHITNEAVFIGLIENIHTDNVNIYIPSNKECNDTHPATTIRLENTNGIRVELNERVVDLYWGDIIEFWGLEKDCDHCDGKGIFTDIVSKSRFPALDWLSYDKESCNSCQGTGKIPVV